MAFLGCKVRALSLSGDKKSIVDVTESAAKKSYANVGATQTSMYRYVPCDSVEVAQSTKKYMLHLVQKLGSQWQLVLFNPYKYPKAKVNNVYKFFLDDAVTVGNSMHGFQQQKLYTRTLNMKLENLLNFIISANAV